MMKSYTLKITVGGRTREQKITADAPVKIQAQAGAQYELLDEAGNVLQPVTEQGGLKWLRPDGDEVMVWVESGGEQVLMPIATSGEVNAPVAEAAGSYAAVTAQTVGIGAQPWLWGAGALVAVGGMVAAASGGKGGGSDNSGSNPPPKSPAATPVITFDPVTEDNIINIAESRQTVIAVSGRVAHAQEGNRVVIGVGGSRIPDNALRGQI